MTDEEEALCRRIEDMRYLERRCTCGEQWQSYLNRRRVLEWKLATLRKSLEAAE